MTSIATARLRLDKQGMGDNPDTWGDRLNATLDMIDESFGFAEIAINGPVTLAVQNFVSDQARRMILRFTGAGGYPVTVPTLEKMYYIDNRCTADVVLKTANTPGSAVVAGTKRIAYCDGATITTDTSASAPPASASSVTPVGGIAATNVQDALQEIDAEKARLDGAAFTGAISAPSFNLPGVGSNYFSSGNGDAATYATFNARLHLHSGLGVETYNGTVTAFFDSRAGFWDTKGAPRVNGQEVWYPGNFNPATKANLTGAAFTGDITTYRAASPGTGVIFLGNSGARYLFYDGGTYQLPASPLNVGGTVTSAGDVVAAGRLIAGNGATASYVEMRDTDEGTRFLHNNSGCIGFLGKDGAWKFQVRDDGTLWCAQFGDVSTRIETRAAAFADDRAQYRVAKTGDTMSGDLRISKTYPAVSLFWGGLQHGQWMIDSDAAMVNRNGDSGYVYHRLATNGAISSCSGWSIQPNGDIYMPWAGDYLSSQLNNKLTKQGGTITGNLSIQPGNYPSVNLLYPGVKWWGMQIRGNGWLYFPEDNLATFNIAFVPGGNIWSNAFGGYITDHINSRAAAYAANRQSQIGQNYDGTNRRMITDGTCFIQGSAVVALDSQGDSYIAFPWAFSRCDSVVACNGDAKGASAYSFGVRDYSPNGFVIRADSMSGRAAGQTVRVHYTAMGY